MTLQTDTPQEKAEKELREYLTDNGQDSAREPLDPTKGMLFS
jgi:hypothetical protein